ncbi:polyprenyl diphosphate synthase [Chloroflexota bacterium]
MNPPPNLKHLPQHIAIIMDGNGRWAEKHHLPRQEGHRRGATSVRHVVELCLEYKIPHLTLYIFSTENWNRPQEEVEGLFKLVEDGLDEGIKLALEKEIKVFHLGKLERLPAKIQEKIKEAVALTRNNKQLTLGLAFNYGSRDEIVEAIQRILNSSTNAQSVTETTICQHLYTSNMPDPDLIIRTGGEKRLSNFLLWQAAYAEIYFTPVLWPDFDRKELNKALDDYNKRQRRFGMLK